MSGIFGILRLDGRAVPWSELGVMERILQHRGPDGSSVKNEGEVGLGHQQLNTTPASLQETLPLEHKESRLMITADARLDNRDELVSLMGISAGVAKQMGDGELILEAYRKWGEACAERLLGDFAFAIWDSRRRTLFCARDHFGVRPLYYHFVADSVFAFASEMKGLLALPGITTRLNPERIGDYLADVFSDSESTFYRDIKRLSPAHTLVVNPEGMRIRRYWSLDPKRDVRLRSNEEYADAFRELFTEAVRCRLRAAGPVGSMLSGGLDSSSITCIARDLLDQNGARKLKTFSVVFDAVSDCDERAYINPILAENGVDPSFIEGSQHGPFQNLKRINWHQDQPAYGPNCDMIWSIYERVRERGVRVLLDGHDGDTTVSYGERYLHELARFGKWMSLTTELRAIARHGGPPAWESLKALAWHYRLKPFVNKHGPLRMVRRIWRGAGRRLFENGQQFRRVGWRDLLNPEFARRINMEERYGAWRQTISRTAPTEREAHYRMLTHPMHAFALEAHDGAAAAFAIEKRYPFWDKRLVEFCLGLPSTQKLNQGRTRVVLRRAMEGVLPPSVQWRDSKTNFVPSLDYNIRTFERGQLDDVIPGMSGVLADYVDIPALRQVHERFLDANVATDPIDIFTIFKTVSLGLWLEDQWSENRESNSRALRGGDSNVSRSKEYEVLRHSFINSRRGNFNATNKRKSPEETLRSASSHRSW